VRYGGVEMKKVKLVLGALLLLALLLVPTTTAFAGSDNGEEEGLNAKETWMGDSRSRNPQRLGNGKNDVPKFHDPEENKEGSNNAGNKKEPADPGAGSGQVVIKIDNVMWVLPHGQNFLIGGQLLNIIENWSLFESFIETIVQPGNGNVEFIGINLGGENNFEEFVNGGCGGGSGLGGCFGNGGGGGGGGGPLPHSDCGDVWVSPGVITANARQIAPTNPVVMGQDPEQNGATVEWNLIIQPTSVYYEKWQIIAHRHVCVPDDPRSQTRAGNGNIDCPEGWHKIVQHIWACATNQKTFKEGIGDLTAKVVLKPGSRAWIEGELASAYPSARLLHPEWEYSPNKACTWDDDVCYWNFSSVVPVQDPGWYEIKVEGLSQGTVAMQPRPFSISAGEFGVYLIDSSAMIQ